MQKISGWKMAGLSTDRIALGIPRSGTFAGRPGRGSATLANLLAILAGLFFTITAVNLYRYAAATNAVHAAVERSLRCLTPTDAECVSAETPSAAGEADWYRGTFEKRETEWGRKFSYSAALVRQTWLAEFESYRIHIVQEPPIILTSGMASVVSYSPEFSRFEHRFARATMSADEQFVETQYKSGPFPQFDLNFERARDDLPAGNWYPIERTVIGGKSQSRPLNINMSSWVSELKLVPAGAEAVFASPKIQVPIVDAGVPCQDQPDLLCRNRDVGPAADAVNWRDYAFIAIKPFAEVDRAGRRNGSIGWGSRQTGAGLWVDIFDSNGNRVEGPGSVSVRMAHSACLGGRSMESVTGRRWYNMWLRGPGGSNGGSHAICPGGDLDHSGIAVPRGGSFQIFGYLAADSADIQARVTYQYYIDRPVESALQVWRRETHRCDSETGIGADEITIDCPAPVDCGFTSAAKNSVCAPSGGAIRSEPVCLTEDAARLDRYAIRRTAVECAEKVVRLTCSPEQVPEKSNCNLAGRAFCGWTKSISTAKVPVSGDCGRVQTETLWCNGSPREVGYRSTGDYVKIDQCPAPAARIEQSRRQYQSLLVDGIKIDSGLVPVSIGQFSIGAAAEFDPPRYENRLDRTGADPAAIEVVKNSVTSNLPIYKHRDESWLPPLGAFPLLAPAGTGFSNGFLEKNVVIRKEPSGDQIREIRAVYPFNLPSAFEIPPVNSNSLTCADMAAASDGPDLETRLRSYAVREDPAAGDPAIEFQSSAIYRGLAQIVSSGPPECPRVAEKTTETFTDQTGTYLGRFGAAQIPPGCSGNKNCFRRPVFDSVPFAVFEPKFDPIRARQTGEHEIALVMPGTEFGCDSPGCSKVVINLTSEREAEVGATYNLPLIFPVNLLIGAGYIPISHSARESIELSSAAARGIGDPAGGSHEN